MAKINKILRGQTNYNISAWERRIRELNKMYYKSLPLEEEGVIVPLIILAEKILEGHQASKELYDYVKKNPECNKLFSRMDFAEEDKKEFNRYVDSIENK